MTISFRHISGSREPLDKTIAYHIRTNWNPANTTLSSAPTIESGTTEPDYDAQMDTTGPNKILCNILSRRKIEIPDGQEPNGDYTHEWVTDIIIEAHSEDITNLGYFEDEINRILWTVAPNNATRLKQSDGITNSEVEYFEENEVEFQRLQAEEGRINDNPASQAILRLHWFKDKS